MVQCTHVVTEFNNNIVARLDRINDGLEAALVRVGTGGTTSTSPVHDLGVLDGVCEVLTPAYEMSATQDHKYNHAGTGRTLSAGTTTSLGHGRVTSQVDLGSRPLLGLSGRHSHSGGGQGQQGRRDDELHC